MVPEAPASDVARQAGVVHGTPFLEKWKELHSQLETMREASKDVKTANGQSGDGVMSTIGNAIANAIDGTSTETTSDCDV